MEGFLAQLTELARHTVLETLQSAFARAGATRVVAPRACYPTSRGSRPDLAPRRTPEDLEALTSQLAAFIQANPGLRVAEINKRLGTTTEQLALPLRKLVAAGRIHTSGSKRTTTYFAFAPGDGEPSRLPIFTAGERAAQPASRPIVDGANGAASPGGPDAALFRCLADVYRLAHKLEK